MYNYTNTALALLVKMNLLTKDSAKHLSEKMSAKIHQSRLEDALVMVDEVLRDAESKGMKLLVEPWKTSIRMLEEKVDELEKELDSQSKMIAQQIAKGTKIKSVKEKVDDK